MDSSVPKMKSGRLLLLFFISLIKKLVAVSTAEGKEFVISTPSMKYPFDTEKGYPKLVLTAISSFDCTVTVVAQGLVRNLAYENVTLNLKAFSPQKFSNPYLFFGPDVGTGYRWTLNAIGTHPFALVVTMLTDVDIVETFIAVPVAGWGQGYIVTTIDKHASVVIVTNEFENLITFTLRSPDDDVKVTIGDFEYRSGESCNIYLPKFNSYAISNCNQNTSEGSFIGSSLKADRPFGVITGNCNGVSDSNICGQTDNSQVEDEIGRTVAEMLLPVETLGRHFILFNLTGRPTSGFYLVTSASLKINLIVTQRDKEETIKHYFRNIGDWWKITANYGTLTTNGPVQVVYVQNSSCSLKRDGQTSIMLLTPVELYYYFYLCMVPNVQMNHYIALVVQSKYSQTISYMYSGNVDPVIERVKVLDSIILWSVADAVWQVNEYRIKQDVSIVVYSLRTRFACYLHGQSARSTYMNSAGFISSNINQRFCSKSVTSKKKGDLLDNDCDGWVDEADLIGTGKNDSIEDILSYFPTLMTFSSFQTDYNNYTPQYIPRDKYIPLEPSDINITHVSSSEDYGEWGEWRCARNCSVREMVRTRICMRLTKGEGCSAPALEVRHGNCYTNFCPLDCPYKSFGQDCNSTCEKCLGHCNKFDGQCEQCSPGYDFPESGCQIERQNYKEWAGWHCTESCQNTFLIRERFCKRQEPEILTGLCMEEVLERKPGDCYAFSKCPTDCVDYTWGENCSSSCEQCTEPCNKFTGECETCRPGYKGIKVGCPFPCGLFEYGSNCHGNCSIKCGEDCRDRVYGHCEEPAPPPNKKNKGFDQESTTSYTPVIVVSVLFVPCVLLALFMYQRRKEEEIEYRKSMIALRAERSKSRQSLASRKSSMRSLRSYKGSIASRGSMSSTAIRLDGTRVDSKGYHRTKVERKSINVDHGEPKAILFDIEATKTKAEDTEELQAIFVANEVSKTKSVDKDPKTKDKNNEEPETIVEDDKEPKMKFKG